MNIFDILAAQTQDVQCVRPDGAPLFAVTLTALPIPNTPVLLMLHWHGFHEQKNPKQADTMAPHQSAASAVLQINQNWHAVAAVDEAMLDAAWQFGAWELDREEKRGCNTAGASDLEALQCQQAFASNPALPEKAQIIDAPDIEDMLSLGARFGYLRWLFRPVRNGIWKHAGTDDSLNENGGREPPCPFGAKELMRPAFGVTRYQLGHQSRLYLP